MNFDSIRHHVPLVVGVGDCRHSAVCIPLLEIDGKMHILFEIRSSKLKDQPGDICFPGGMTEKSETPEETAVRETSEELMISPDDIELIGPGDILMNPQLEVRSFAAKIRNYSGQFNRSEVAEVFTVPLEDLLPLTPDIYWMSWNPGNFPENFPFDKIAGGKNYRWRDRSECIYFFQYRERTIWGMTAKLLHSFLEIIRSEEE